MAAITGIELGPDSCVLVRAQLVRGATEVSNVHIVGAGDWPSQDVAVADLLRRVRREKGFPRSARVVAWGLPDSASASDPATRGALRPLLSAGFRIQTVMSPPHALALLAVTRPRGGAAAAAWLALNRNGAAIAIVRGGELLFARTFEWAFKGSAIGSQAQLLERYSLVAHLAPELRRGVDLVRTKHGVAVECAVTCGNLPDLRSLTMPLIEELDLEVETLDSAEGLAIAGQAKTQGIAELAPSMRLAAASATAPATARRVAGLPAWAVAAAGLVLVTGVVWWGYSRRSAQPIRPVAQRAAAAPAARDTSVRKPANPRLLTGPAKSAAATHPANPVTPKKIPDTTPARTAQSQSASASSGKQVQPAAVPAPKRIEKSHPVVPSVTTTKKVEASRREVATSRRRAGGVEPARTPTAGRTAAAPPQRQSQPPVAKQSTTPPPATTSKIPTASADTKLAPRPPSGQTRPQPRPLDAPVPAVTSILISSDRRLAVIDGAIVSVGDAVGPRVVVRIEQTAVVLREPSGFELRVPLR